MAATNPPPGEGAAMAAVGIIQDRGPRGQDDHQDQKHSRQGNLQLSSIFSPVVFANIKHGAKMYSFIITGY